MQNTKEKGSRRREEETKEMLAVKVGSGAFVFRHCAPARWVAAPARRRVTVVCRRQTALRYTGIHAAVRTEQPWGEGQRSPFALCG